MATGYDVNVVNKLREMGKTGGTINVSAPAAPYFSPAAPQ